ncbi:adenosylhomocysteine nucleosidase [Chitinophaga skermanii]|uniref:Adenosylhomocysteine nucleosidase n=1 Tax=Chitinophaga skermanii TaxID=331697 RepID=A0A327Q3F4_9BACT|nr:nucleosidase [Chitinophaga skermanii]RAI97712.1 adenosylhomocysteine nucleosidase [Chitinophaga skermanii]
MNATIVNLLKEQPLFVFALSYEAAEEFVEYDPLFVGIGKVNAAYHLTKAIAQKKPSIIVNLGSAGSSTFKRGEIVCCTKFIQRDMDVRGLGFELYETPLSGIPTVLEYGLAVEHAPLATIGTGDSFEMGHAVTAYNVVDMEAYPLAFIAQQENIPFLCLKYITDGADDSAAEEWSVQVHHAAVAFKAMINGMLETEVKVS